jgi:predicted Ser/Thr protein kinase
MGGNHMPKLPGNGRQIRLVYRGRIMSEANELCVRYNLSVGEVNLILDEVRLEVGELSLHDMHLILHEETVLADFEDAS